MVKVTVKNFIFFFLNLFFISCLFLPFYPTGVRHPFRLQETPDLGGGSPARSGSSRSSDDVTSR